MAELRFHCDENVDPAIAEGLTRRGIDVTTSRDVGLLSAKDPQQIAFAAKTQRVLITHDEDFLALARNGVQHAGIAYCHVERRSIGQIIAGLMLIHDSMSEKDMQNHIEFL